MMMVKSEELREQMMREAEMERRLKEEERERRKRIKEDFDRKLSRDSSIIEYSCPHCSFKAKASEKLALQFFYCKRCEEVQTQPTKKVVETVTEKEYRGFWRWFWHKPATIRRTIYSEIVDCKPKCHICKRTDMMVPFDKEHCPVCGNLLERNDDSWF